MRCVVKHPPGIDGVAFGTAGDFPDNVAVRALCDAGLLVPEGESPVRPDAGGPRHDEFVAALAARDARIAELEVEVAQLRMDLEAATAPESAKKGQS